MLTLKFSDEMAGSLVWAPPPGIEKMIEEQSPIEKQFLLDAIPSLLAAQVNILIAALKLEDRDGGIQLITTSNLRLADAIQMMV